MLESYKNGYLVITSKRYKDDDDGYDCCSHCTYDPETKVYYETVIFNALKKNFYSGKPHSEGYKYGIDHDYPSLTNTTRATTLEEAKREHELGCEKANALEPYKPKISEVKTWFSAGTGGINAELLGVD